MLQRGCHGRDICGALLALREAVANPVTQVAQYPLIPAGPKAEVALDAAGLTDIGEHRDKNEDAYLIGTLHRSLIVHDATASAEGWFAGEPAGTLLVVADGMGGQGGGDIASRTAVNAVSSYLLNALPWAKPAPGSGSGNSRESLMGVRQGLFSALVASDQVVRTTGVKSGSPHMGTTLTAALVLWPVMYVAHVGDTRCYLLRAGKLHRLTTDHNLAEKLGPQESRRHAEDLQNILWNTLGASDELPRPELSKLDLLPGDTLLLCSDGLNKHVTDEQIQTVLESGSTSRASCARLVELALEGGGTDNVTAVVAQLKQGTSAQPARPYPS
jgi:protein phosphatase